MTHVTWVDIITTHYNIPSELKYNGKTLIKVIHQTKWLATILITTGQGNEHTNIFQKWYTAFMLLQEVKNKMEAMLVKISLRILI
jgi:hypothetical protein